MKLSGGRDIGPWGPVDDERATDISILSRCRNGDRTAFRDLHRLHYPFVFRMARRLGTPAAELDDVCQDVFLAAFKNLDRFKEGQLASWLYRITANIVTARHRRRRVREKLFSWWGRSEVVRPSPEDQLDSKRAEHSVARTLQQMSPKKREVFVLFELEGLTGEQISERVGCTLGTVWTRLFHARKEFRELAEKSGVVERE